MSVRAQTQIILQCLSAPGARVDTLLRIKLLCCWKVVCEAYRRMGFNCEYVLRIESFSHMFAINRFANNCVHGVDLCNYSVCNYFASAGNLLTYKSSSAQWQQSPLSKTSTLVDGFRFQETFYVHMYPFQVPFSCESQIFLLSSLPLPLRQNEVQKCGPNIPALPIAFQLLHLLYVYRVNVWEL